MASLEGGRATRHFLNVYRPFAPVDRIVSLDVSFFRLPFVASGFILALTVAKGGKHDGQDEERKEERPPEEAT
jgi:hypothetical protein